MVSAIDYDDKVGAAAELVCGVQWIVKPLVEVSAQSGGKMRAGGEAQDSNAVWINMPLGGVGAYDAEGALSILQRRRRLGIWARLGHTVLNQDATDAGRIEPVAYFRSFEVNGQDAVSAAGKYN